MSLNLVASCDIHVPYLWSFVASVTTGRSWAAVLFCRGDKWVLWLMLVLEPVWQEDCFRWLLAGLLAELAFGWQEELVFGVVLRKSWFCVHAVCFLYVTGPVCIATHFLAGVCSLVGTG